MSEHAPGSSLTDRRRLLNVTGWTHSDDMGRDLPHTTEPNHQSGQQTNVVPLNDAGAVFDALATGIRGSAIGWPPGALEKLETALEARYGHLIGGTAGVRRLLVLAQEPSAA